MINKIDDGSASLNFADFCLLMSEKTVEVDPETLFKDTFRVFSKDEDGENQTYMLYLYLRYWLVEFKTSFHFLL